MSSPKEIGITLYQHEVLRILSGEQTQLRRAVKRINGIGQVTEFQRSDTPGLDWIMRDKGMLWNDFTHAELLARCPYGKPGDRLWVRETWQGPILDDDEYEEYRRNGKESYLKPQYCVYRATDQLNAIDEDSNELNWRPSIHMPRWASRITLEVTGIRVERLQDISESDCRAEGIVITEALTLWHEYQLLWKSLNGEGSWNLNPIVWVVEFKRILP